MTNIRDLIIRELKRKNRTAYWLGEQIDTCHRTSVHKYVAGTIDTTGKNIGAMLDALGLEIRRKKR